MNYINIKFNDACAVEINSVICPWNELYDYLQGAETNFTESDKAFLGKNGKPQIIIEPLDWTDEKYNKWFAKNVKP